MSFRTFLEGAKSLGDAITVTRAAKAFSALVVALYLSLTVIYVTPLTPVQRQLHPILQDTVDEFFSQNWSLFAPSPMAENYTLLVRPMAGVPGESGDSLRVLKEGWYNLSEPLWERFQQNRFSAYGRVARPQSNAVRQYITGGYNLRHLSEACDQGDEEACSTYRKQMGKARERAAGRMARVASAFCKDIGLPKSRCTHVAVRIRIDTPPPWSKRYSDRDSTRYYNVGVLETDYSVVPSGLFKGTNPASL
jgi:hypothetical protein